MKKFQNQSELQEVVNNLWRLHPSSLAARIDKRFIRYRHVDYISKTIARAILNGNARIIIETPPRHGKSWLLSKSTPTWFLSHFPHQNVLLASYEADFASQWGRLVRNNALENPELKIDISDDSSSASRWNTPQGGGMGTAGVGGAITGKGGNLLLIDDVVKNSEQADSPTYRKKAIEWWNTTFYTRAEPNASIIVLGTRWHENDLLGYLQSEENETRDEWTVIRLPAIAEIENDPIGRSIGDALCPERYDIEALNKIKKAVGSRAWNALYQQRPSGLEGSVIKKEWLRFYTQLPNTFHRVIQSWDLTFKDAQTSDFVVGQVWGVYSGKKYLLDQFRGRLGFVDSCNEIIRMTSKWPAAHVKYIEEKANGSAVIEVLKTRINGIKAINPKDSKESRLNAVSAQFERGDVLYPDKSIAPWIQDNIDELLLFPNASHDDTVDATSQALIQLEGGFNILDKMIRM
jgi:predicted phage terminase large subunit-like protein